MKAMLMDGATGTRLQAAGMPEGVCSENWVLENPEVFVDIQKSYVAAGARLLLTPTFGANGVKLAQHGIEDVEQYNIRLAELTRRAAGEDALVAADIAPTGSMIYPYGDSSVEELRTVFRRQAAALEQAGVDLFVIETMMSLPEARAALMGVREVSEKPVWVTFTADENGRTLTGGTVEAALVTMQAMGADAVGLNCSAGPEGMLENIRRMSAYTKVPLIAKPNAGLPKIKDGKTYFDLTPQEFCNYVPQLFEAGVRMFGGCCGTDERHIAALCSELESLSDVPAVLARDEWLASERVVFRASELGEFDTIDCTEDLADDLMDAEGEPVCIRIAGETDIALLAENIHTAGGIVGFNCDSDELLEKALLLYNGRAFVTGKAEPRYGAVKI